MQQDAGPIVTTASGATPALPVFWSGSFGQFEAVYVAGFGQPGAALPNLLQAITVQNNNAGPANAGTLTIYVTSTGNIGVPGPLGFASGFATISLKNGWTETLEAYLDPNNGVYQLTTLLGSEIFNAPAQAATD